MTRKITKVYMVTRYEKGGYNPQTLKLFTSELDAITWAEKKQKDEAENFGFAWWEFKVSAWDVE